MNTIGANVGTVERVTRIGGGALAALAGLYVLVSGSSVWLNGLAVAGIVLGLDFIYTGVTGYCPLYAKLRWSTARRRAPVQSALASAGSTSAVRVGFLGGARMVLPVPDLACAGGDALALDRMIEKVPCVLRAYVNPATENAYIDYAPDRVTSAAIGAKVRELGYGAKASAR